MEVYPIIDHQQVIRGGHVFSVDSDGLSKGLITGWNGNIQLLNFANSSFNRV